MHPYFGLDVEIEDEGMQLFKFFEKTESKFEMERTVNHAFSDITPQMRMVLVDWLIDVSMHFELKFETLHLAILYLQRFLSTNNKSIIIHKQNLQLVGVAAIKVADVYNQKSREYYRQDNATEYSKITAQEYSTWEVINMEKIMLNELGFKLWQPTMIHWIKLLLEEFFGRAREDGIFLKACFLADLMLLHSEHFSYRYDQLAYACILITLLLVRAF
jgi:hypothetical protein